MNSIKIRFDRRTAAIFFLAVGVLFSWNCSNPENSGGYFKNKAPITRLSNVPPLDVVTKMENPRVTLNWVGDDQDGFVTGFKYTWTYRSGGIDLQHPYSFILNIIIEEFALMVITDDQRIIPGVYHYFATLPPGVGLETSRSDSLKRGDTIWVNGFQVYASNPDSIRIQTGQRVKYSFPVHVNPNSGTFIFDSPDSMNFHTFKVAAIDNEGESSTYPAEVSFETPQVVAPHTRMEGPFPADTSLVIAESTATFRGINFHYKGIDPNSRTLEYRWVVDKDQWIAKTGNIPWSEFSPSENCWVQADDFPDPFATRHTFYVQSRNEFGSVDTVGRYIRIIRDQNFDSIGVAVDSAWLNFNTIYPSFRRTDLPPTNKILLINNSFNDPQGTIIHPTYQMIDSFYIDILKGLGFQENDISVWRAGKDIPPPPIPPAPEETGFPGRGEISKYKFVIFYADHTVDETYTLGNKGQFFTATRQAVLRDYCYIGGNLIIGGWALTGPYGSQRNEEFFSNILHVNLNKLGPIVVPEGANFYCVGATGLIGYPTLSIDPAKVDTSWNGGMTWLMTGYPTGFGEIIHKYRSLSLDPFVDDISLSIRYNGITFNVVYFGVPLYYMQRPAVDSTLAVAIRDISK